MNASPESGFGLSEIGQIAVPVGDLERAVAFYRDVLGMRFLFQAPPGLAFFQCGGVRLMLDAPARAQGEPFKTVIYYKVPEIHQACEALKARGAVFSEEPHVIAKLKDHDLWMAFLNDPDSNPVGIMCEVKP